MILLLHASDLHVTHNLGPIERFSYFIIFFLIIVWYNHIMIKVMIVVLGTNCYKLHNLTTAPRK